MAASDGRNDRGRDKRAAKETAEAEFSDLYSVEYLADVASGNAREERLEELKRRIALGAYKPDPDAIAEGMLSRVGLGDSDED